MLPERVASLFHEIRRGRPFPYVWLATVDSTGRPRVRSVRLSGFNLRQGLFYVSSNRRHNKRDELGRTPWAELCVVETDIPLQLRFECRVELLEDDETPFRQRFWAKLPAEDQRRFYASTDPRPPDDFMVLQLEAFEVDFLDLRPQVPIRIGYRLGDEVVEELRPV